MCIALKLKENCDKKRNNMACMYNKYNIKLYMIYKYEIVQRHMSLYSSNDICIHLKEPSFPMCW